MSTIYCLSTKYESKPIHNLFENLDQHKAVDEVDRQLKT